MARPTKLTPDRRARLLSALRGGNTRRASCQYAGIGESTLADWLKRNRELRLAVEEAETEVEIRCAALLQKASLKDWRAALAWLERRRPADWSRRTQVEAEVRAEIGGLDHVLSEIAVRVAGRAIEGGS